MTRYSKLRELVTLARSLGAEAGRMAPDSRGRLDRVREAEGYWVKAMWLAGRITDEEYGEYLTEQQDARAYAE